VLQFCHGKEWKEILMSAKRVIKAGLPDHVVHISTTTTTTMFNVVLTLSYGFDASRRNAQQNMRERTPGWRGTPWNFWWGCAARISKSRPNFRPNNCHFPHPLSDLASKIHTRLQT